MKPRFRNVAVILILVLILLLIFLASGKGEKVKKSRNLSEVKAPKVESTVPYVPQVVKFDTKSLEILTKNLPAFKVSGSLLLSPSESQVIALAKALNFFSEPQKRPSYGRGSTYSFADERGRVLVIKTEPYSLDYAEETKGENQESAAGLPQLYQAEEKTLEILKKLNLRLPREWQIKLIRSVFVASEGLSAREVPNFNEANFVKVTLGYFYQGYKVLTANGGSEFIEFVFDSRGSVSSLKILFLVNNPDLLVEKVGDFGARSLEAVNRAFAAGEAKAVSLGVAGEISEEPILTPPKVANLESLETVFVLSEESLYPYYSVTARGTLNSGRTGEVLYLLPAVGEVRGN